MSTELLGRVGRSLNPATHQFLVVRAGRQSWIVDPTFSQFLPAARMGEAITPGFLDTPSGARFVRDLVSNGYVPLTRENAAFYAGALRLDTGPIGGAVPGPVGRLILNGDPHYSTLRFESVGSAEAGSIQFNQRFAPSRMTREELGIRELRIGNVDRPQDLAEVIRQVLRDAPQATSPQMLAVRQRMERQLRSLDDLAARYSGETSNVGPWRGRVESTE
jgi:hypothetical protein